MPRKNTIATPCNAKTEWYHRYFASNESKKSNEYKMDASRIKVLGDWKSGRDHYGREEEEPLRGVGY
jgi:hypothetical protein